ncbi:MAG: hypothetical protein HKN12_05205, partial [Gemmatimonadetes bacterium]|nr:hypothetical protein [Gemmatimonadota bacterium]
MARSVRIDDLYRFILPGAPALSPDASRVVFPVKRVNRKENRYESHLWLGSPRGGRPRQLTHGKVSDGGAKFSPDGRRVAFVSDRDEKSGIWLMRLDGGEPRLLMATEGGPITDLQWSPDGKEILFNHFSVPKRTDEQKKQEPTFRHITSLYHKEDGHGWFEGEHWSLWTVRVGTGQAKELTKGPHHDREGRWSPDGKRIAFTSARGDDSDRYPDQNHVFVMDRNGKNVRNLTPTAGSRETVRWSGDSAHVYFVGFEGGPGEWLYHEHSVCRVPVAGRGKSKAQVLNPGHDRWVMNMVGSDTAVGFGSVLEPYLDDDGNERVAFGSDEDGSYRIYSVSAEGGDVREEITGKLSVLGMAVRRETGEAVYLAATTGDTGELYRAKLNGTDHSFQLTKLTAPFLRPLKYNKPEEIRFKSGRHEIQGWILKPPTYRAGKKYPCLIEVHGGPMTQYGEAWFH